MSNLKTPEWTKIKQGPSQKAVFCFVLLLLLLLFLLGWAIHSKHKSQGIHEALPLTQCLTLNFIKPRELWGLSGLYNFSYEFDLIKTCFKKCSH